MTKVPEKLYAAMSIEWLLDMRRAFVLDREAAHGGARTVAFCDARITAIDRELEKRKHQ